MAVQVLSKAVNRDDHPVSVAVVTLLDRRSWLADDSVLGQIDASVGEPNKLRGHTRRFHTQHLIIPVKMPFDRRLNTAHSAYSSSGWSQAPISIIMWYT